MSRLMLVEKLIKVDILCHAIYNIHEPGYVFSGHLHNTWELVYIKKGSAIASADEQVFKLNEGQLLFHKPLQFHQVMTDGDKPVELLILEFAASGPAMECFESKIYDLNKAEFKQYYSAFINLSEAGNLYKYNDTLDTYNMYLSKAATELELFLLNMLDKQPSNETKLSVEAEYYKKIISVMSENCEKHISIDEIATLCNMSRSNLKRVFAMYNNVGIAKYMLTLRLQRASELIKNNIPVAEVAERLNFSSPQYFQTVFKRELGVTPTQFRKGIYKN